MNYNEIKDAIKGAPKTYLPGLLVCVVSTALEKHVFKPGGAARIAQACEDEAYENSAIMQNDQAEPLPPDSERGRHSKL